MVGGERLAILLKSLSNLTDLVLWGCSIAQEDVESFYLGTSERLTSLHLIGCPDPLYRAMERSQWPRLRSFQFQGDFGRIRNLDLPSIENVTLYVQENAKRSSSLDRYVKSMARRIFKERSGTFRTTIVSSRLLFKD